MIALVTAGIAASIRGNLAAVLQHQFLDPIDPVHSAQMIGTVLGMAFFGFALTIMIGSPLLDYLGHAAADGAFVHLFYCGYFGRDFCRAAFCLVLGVSRALERGPDQRYRLGLDGDRDQPTGGDAIPRRSNARLNLLHAWWPGGLIIGGLIGAASAS